MLLDDMTLTILHVEDDSVQARLVNDALRSLGFNGVIVVAEGIAKALDLLDESLRRQRDINLILVDIQLADGNGLDLIREIKSDPAWQVTPVVVLSGETAAGKVNEAFALGANCYLPKIPKEDSSFNVFCSLYECWIKGALLPRTRYRDRLKMALSTAARLRARYASFYTRLATLFEQEPEEAEFWLGHSTKATCPICSLSSRAG